MSGQSLLDSFVWYKTSSPTLNEKAEESQSHEADSPGAASILAIPSRALTEVWKTATKHS